ncbi:MAG: hypothetical protein U1E70_16840 [Acetobacteraceae bacterium]|nr:hypothetical protein [Pseudomonadota bacterium]
MSDDRSPAQLRFLADRARRLAVQIAHYDAASAQLLDYADKLEALAEKIENGDRAVPRLTELH